MIYPVLLILHLFAALMFIGTVFFEVLILESVRKHVPAEAIGLIWLRYLPALAAPLASPFNTLLTLKVMLAASVLGHFFSAMWLFSSKRMTGRYLRIIHLSLFCHMVGIVLLAKGMF